MTWLERQGERLLARARSAQRASEVPFDAQLEPLPEPARRYLRHALGSGAAAPRAVWLETRFEMRLRPGSAPSELVGSELLAPPWGFCWEARTRWKGLPVRVRDLYVDSVGRGAVDLLGVLPLARGGGPDVTRSARGRAAAESIWLPSALLPSRGARWEALDDERCRVSVSIDGVASELTLHVEPSGALREFTMLRHGDVGVSAWGPLPYGARVLEERLLDGLTVPVRLLGGWGYGSEDFRAEQASRFELTGARYLA